MANPFQGVIYCKTMSKTYLVSELRVSRFVKENSIQKNKIRQI